MNPHSEGIFMLVTRRASLSGPCSMMKINLYSNRYCCPCFSFLPASARVILCFCVAVVSSRCCVERETGRFRGWGNSFFFRWRARMSFRVFVLWLEILGN